MSSSKTQVLCDYFADTEKPSPVLLLPAHGTLIQKKDEWQSMERDKLFFDPI